ncbi:MAG: undecaprenyl/decaprenyl-phosphate alpha-N-acetylglucosaminyl 1-phosphate transferase [Candidatus Kerfeldbacteria bacterium]|nr:undecaprenyl/decaprenyl-phosphate alpha-N-acetylglucosaminyl 1-phosphate transferase [Candidatus Kerfeldbacteria bacterium]
MSTDILIIGISTFFLSVVFTILVRRFALAKHIIDEPTHERKQHARSTPLLGGMAVIVACSIGLLVASPWLVHGYLLWKHLAGVLLGGLIIGIGGGLDDRYNLPPRYQVIAPVLAVVVIVASGVGIDYVTNPLGGIWRLDVVDITLFRINGLPYSITVFSDVFTVVWLLGMMYTTKFLDGLDGLVSGITVIGMFILFWLSLSQEVYQPETAGIAFIVGCAFAGFLVLNFHPAKIFLGEAGSLYPGFMLGVLSIISGGKIATALLIMGIPILDVAWIIVRRLFFEKRSPFAADRKHLHFRLVDIGLSQRQAVLVLYTLTAVFGTISLFLESKQKIVAMGVLVFVMVVVAAIVVRAYRRKSI